MDAQIDRAAELIRSGELVAFPTETVYGLGANALDTEAVSRIYAAKGRPSTIPLIVHVASIEMARNIVATWPAAAERLGRRFWPGPLTLVLPKHPLIPGNVTAGLDTVAIRIPAHPIALALIRAAGVPIAAPSANRFTEISPTTADHVRSSLGDKIALILDGGPTDVGIESTVLLLATPGAPALLRPGMVSQQALEEVIGRVEFTGPEGRTNGSHPSPGLHRKHYSPRTPVILGTEPPPRSVYVWWRTRRSAAKDVRMPDDPASYAARLYGVLHALDGENWDCIVFEPPPEQPEWAGIRDRLLRAAAVE